MPTDPQPEETATRPLAAGASFAGSLAQTRTYGRGARLRAEATGKQQPGQQQAAEQDRPKPEATAPARDGAQPGPAADAGAELAAEPAAGVGAELTEPAVGRLDRSLDDPAVHAELLFSGLAGASATTVAAGPAGTATSGEPVVSSDMVVAASAQDAAAAQSRMALSQLPEPAPVTPPAPGLGPAL